MATQAQSRLAHGHSSGREPFYRPTEAAQTVEELTRRNVETICKLEEAAKEPRNWGDRIADFITAFCGSMTFVWAHVFWFGGWLILNVLLPRRMHFDPYPFNFLTLVVSLEAIFLSTFILISQNRETRMADRRNHLDLQVNLLSEQENTKMLQMLEAIAQKVGANVHGDNDLKVLEEATDPEKLVEQIDCTLNGSDNGNDTDEKNTEANS